MAGQERELKEPKKLLTEFNKELETLHARMLEP